MLRPPKTSDKRGFVDKMEYDLYDLVSPGNIGILHSKVKRVMCSLLNSFYERYNSD